MIPYSLFICPATSLEVCASHGHGPTFKASLCVSMRNCGNMYFEIFSQHTTFHIPVILGHHQAWETLQAWKVLYSDLCMSCFFLCSFLLVFPLLIPFICFHSLQLGSCLRQQRKTTLKLAFNNRLA